MQFRGGLLSAPKHSSLYEPRNFFPPSLKHKTLDRFSLSWLHFPLSKRLREYSGIVRVANCDCSDGLVIVRDAVDFANSFRREPGHLMHEQSQRGRFDH